jgi:hypothetical protein
VPGRVPGPVEHLGGALVEHPALADGRVGAEAGHPGTVVAQVVPGRVGAPHGRTAVDEQDPCAALGEHARRHPAAGAGAEHHHVVGVVDPGEGRRGQHRLDRARRQLRGRRPVPEHAGAGAVAVAVERLGGDVDEQVAGVGIEVAEQRIDLVSVQRGDALAPSVAGALVEVVHQPPDPVGSGLAGRVGLEGVEVLEQPGLGQRRPAVGGHEAVEDGS